jgi:hypothetical protein
MSSTRLALRMFAHKANGSCPRGGCPFPLFDGRVKTWVRRTRIIALRQHGQS